MSHQPFRELTKHFSPERRAYIEAGKAKIRDKVAQEKAEREGRGGTWRVRREAAEKEPAKAGR